MALHSASQSLVILTNPASSLWTCLPGESLKQQQVQDVAMLCHPRRPREGKMSAEKACLSISWGGCWGKQSKGFKAGDGLACKTLQF